MIAEIALALLAAVAFDAPESVEAAPGRLALVAECVSERDGTVGFRLQLGVQEDRFIGIDPVTELKFPYPNALLIEEDIEFMSLPPVETRRLFIMGWKDPLLPDGKGGRIMFTVENSEMGEIKVFDQASGDIGPFDCTFQDIAALSLEGVT